MTKRSLPAVARLLAGLALAASFAAVAGGGDHERARRALEAGEVLPLRAVLERVERDYPGQVVEVELEREDGAWLYEIKLIRPGGAVVKLRLDAHDGTLYAAEGRELHPGGRRAD